MSIGNGDNRSNNNSNLFHSVDLDQNTETTRSQDDDGDVERGNIAATPTTTHNNKRLHASHAKGMEHSTLRFQNINFVVGKNETQKHILTDVTGQVHSGHVLAIMGPSGAGKTTLISSLTLDARYGTAIGSVTLNGVPLTDKIFKQHCFVVKQHDKLWPYLTCRETLRYAAQLYDVATPENIDGLVDEIIVKMGLTVCADTRNARLSGGQQRRLSVGIALLKQPRVLFLDEPTSGLDAAAASSIMKEIVRVAKEEKIIILCTIHQPSTKVFQGFDQTMLMSRGRTAYMGDVDLAETYFESIGHPLPPATNPAEFYLDLVNADFSDQTQVDKLLDAWEEANESNTTGHSTSPEIAEQEESNQVNDIQRNKFGKEFRILLRRQATMMVRDPVLYVGRCLMFLISCMMFSLVYFTARHYTQDQAQNKFWLDAWLVGVPSNMAVVAVYVLNEEWKAILTETKNGMVSGAAYVVAKSLLVLPILFIFAIFALGLPLFAVQNVPGSAFGILILLYAVLMFVYESLAECLSVWFENPIIGMLQFMNFWFASFLFGGFLIAKDDMYWPFTLFYYIMPYSYYLRSFVYQEFTASTWEACTDESNSHGVCVDSTSGKDVLDALGQIEPLFSSTNTTTRDIGVMLAIGAFYKLLYIFGVIYKGSKAAKFKEA